MSGEQIPGREVMGTDGGCFFNVSVTHDCVCFLAESYLGPETAPCSVQPVLGCERTVVDGNFLKEPLSCEGDSEGREEANKG